MQRRDMLSWMALAGVAGALPRATAAADALPTPNSAPQPQRRSSAMANANELVVNYIAAWNEQDPKRRREIVARTWTETGSYTDAHRKGTGHEGIDAMIATAQKQFPGYRIRLISKIESHNGYLRFSWAAGGTEQAPLYLGGTDFAVAAGDGRLQSVVGFVDAAPAPVTV